jgi:hypothetical protein
VVAEIESLMRGSFWMIMPQSVDFPAPDGDEMMIRKGRWFMYIPIFEPVIC